MFGGEPGPAVSAKTEQWDDSTWTEIADLSTARARGGSGGNALSAFFAAGATPSATAGVNPTEEWDFTQTRAAGAWASGGAVNDGRGQMGNVGDIPAALVMGGYAPNKATCESYDGSSWTEEDDLNTGRQYCAAFGSTTAALVVGGNPAAVDATETWNGSSWTTNPATLASGRQKFGTSNRSPSTSGLIFAGQNTGGPPWYSVILTESWDGSSWTEEPDVNTERESGGSVGTQTACLLIAGHRSDSPPGARTHVESWNGSSWSEGPDVNTGRQSVCCSGTTTSALIGGGTAPPATAITEQYDGTSWTEVADLSAAREGLAKGAGASGHSCLAAGVDGSPNTIVEEWTQPQNIKIITD